MPLPATCDVSIIIPVYDKLELTRACVASLLRETSEASFEIVVVDNGSTDGTGQWLAGEAAAGRLRIVAPGKNLGFAAGCNAGAEAAGGRHLLFLNNDTEVTSGWLDPLVMTLDRDPDVHAVGSKLLYPDGSIQHGGVALVAAERGPLTMLEGIHLGHHKPADFAGANHPQRLQAVSAALMAVRRDVFEELGGFDTSYWNGNEDLDLCLRMGERGGLVVYRPESVVVHHESQSGDERWSRVADNVRLLNDRWLGRAQPDFKRAADGTVTSTGAGCIGLYATPTVSLAEPEERGTVSVVVLTWNAPEYVGMCADSLLRHTDPRHEVLFVDNGSGRETLELLDQLEAAHPQVTVIRNGKNLGFAAGNNVGLAHGRGEHFCLLNSDTVVTEGWLDRLLARFDEPDVGLVGPMTNNIGGPQKLATVGYDDRTLKGLDTFAADWAGQEAGRSEPVLWAVGFCLLIHRRLVATIGGLDERFGQGNYEDNDYCLRALLAGWRTVVARDSFVHHFGSRSFVAGQVDYMQQIAERWEIFRRKWNLPAAARETGDLNLETMVAEGFAPVLHAEALPSDGRAVRLPLATWEIERSLERGELLYTTDRLDEAVRVFRAVLRDHPANDRAAGNLACALWRSAPDDGGDEAVSLLEGVLERNPDDTDARWNLEEMRAAACGAP